MTTVIKAIETDLAREFDSLVTDIIAGNADVDIELDWLSEYLLAHWGGNCEYIAYHVASLSDWGFSDEAIQDAHYHVKADWPHQDTNRRPKTRGIQRLNQYLRCNFPGWFMC